MPGLLRSSKRIHQIIFRDSLHAAIVYTLPTVTDAACLLAAVVHVGAPHAVAAALDEAARYVVAEEPDEAVRYAVAAEPDCMVAVNYIVVEHNAERVAALPVQPAADFLSEQFVAAEFPSEHLTEWAVVLVPEVKRDYSEERLVYLFFRSAW